MRLPPSHKRLFQPQSPEELLKGWTLHAHKGRDRHDETARRLDRYHRCLGVLAAIFAAIAGTAFLADMGKQANPSLPGYIAGSIGFIAAVLASIQTASNFASRAESHRIAGVNYKSIIRKLEYLMSEPLQPGTSHDGKLETALRGIEKELDELETKSPGVPPSIYRYIEGRYENVDFVGTAVLLTGPALA